MWKPCSIFLPLICFLLHTTAYTEEIDYLTFKSLLENNQPEKALEIANKLVKNENVTAEFYFDFGVALLEEKLLKFKDKKRAIQYLEKASSMGSLEATSYLGRAYFTGENVDKSCKEGAEYFYIASRQGHLGVKLLRDAGFSLSECLAEQMELASDILKESHFSDEGAVLSTIAHAYFFGDGLEENLEETYSYFKRSAQLNNCDGIYGLGAMYDNGIFTEPNVALAFSYFSKGDRLGCIEAKVALAHMYYSGRYVDEDLNIAFELYLQSSEQGDLEAKSMLGMMYLRGEADVYDPVKGVSLIKYAAEEGFDRAQVYYAGLFFTGTSVEQSFANAKAWYLKAIDSDPFAQSAIAQMYEYGLGVEQNFKLAEKYYLKALKQGNVEAIEGLARWLVDGRFYDRNHTKAAQLLKSNLDLQNQRIVGLYSMLLSCSSNKKVYNPQEALKLIEQQIDWHGENINDEIIMAKAAALSTQNEFDKAIQLLIPIKSEINEFLTKYENYQLFKMNERFESLFTDIKAHRQCSI